MPRGNITHPYFFKLKPDNNCDTVFLHINLKADFLFFITVVSDLLLGFHPKAKTMPEGAHGHHLEGIHHHQ